MLPTPEMYRKGRPPQVGWWPASINAQALRVYRWWDGTRWSLPAHPTMNEDKAEVWASRKSTNQNIMWRLWLPGEDGGKLPLGFVA